MNRNEIMQSIDPLRFTMVRPDNMPSLKDLDLKNKLISFPEIQKDTLVIVNDQYRSTPTQRIIKILRELDKIKHGISFIIATGTHIPPSYEEAVAICNAKKNDKIILHDVNKLIKPGFAGITSRGTNVFYNPVIDSYKNIMTIGSVEPHYFAGFTGGAKSLMPGISSLKTIIDNHKLAMNINSDLMKTEGNPVFEDIWEAANLISPLNKIYTIQLVNHGGSIMYLSHGNIRDVFQSTKVISTKIFAKTYNKKFDRVISFIQPPLNKNLYQSHKGITNTKNILKRGGTLVIISECNDINGNNTFMKKLSKLGSYQRVLKEIPVGQYEFGDHKVYKLAEAAELFELLYVGDLPSKTVKTAFMKKISENELLRLCNDWHSSEQDVLIDEAGGFTAYKFEPINSISNH